MRLKYILIISIFTLLLACPSFGQVKDEDWTILNEGQSALGVEFRRDGAVYYESKLLMLCPTNLEEPNGSEIQISSPSKTKKLIVVHCMQYYAESTALIVDTLNKEKITKDIVPPYWSLSKWLSWSPNEDYLLLAAAGEVTNGDMFVVNLKTARSTEITFRKFIKNDELELQELDFDKTSWINPTNYSLVLDVKCNPYVLGERECDRTKVLQSHHAQVNVLTSAVTYGTAKTTTNEDNSLFMDGDYILVPIPKTNSKEMLATQNLYPITIKDKTGFIDSNGKVVIPPKYFTVSEFCEELAAVGVQIVDGEAFHPRYGYIDKKGNYLFTPKFNHAGCFSEGLASVTLDASGKSGFINKKGEFAFFHNYESAGKFSNGLALVKRGEKYGYIDKTGRLAISLLFDAAFDFADGMAQVGIGTFPNQKFGFIDTKGNYLVKPRFEGMVGGFSEGLASLSVGLYPNSKYGYIDINGNFVINPQFEYAGEFSEGLAPVIINKKYGFIDKTGKVIIPPVIDGASNFQEGLAPVLIGNTYGFINKKGEIVIPNKFEQVSAFVGGIAKVFDLDKEYYINKSGEPIWLPNEVVSSYGNLSDEQLNLLVLQMTKDEVLNAECIEESENPKRLVNINLIDLNKDGKPEFQVIGQGCACQGARRCFSWIYAKTTVGFRLLLDIGPADEISPLKTLNKGYFDIQASLPGGDGFVIMTYTFNGQTYQEKKCEIVDPIGINKGEPVFGKPKPC